MLSFEEKEIWAGKQLTAYDNYKRADSLSTRIYYAEIIISNFKKTLFVEKMLRSEKDFEPLTVVEQIVLLADTRNLIFWDSAGILNRVTHLLVSLTHRIG
jgi:hypothetical protein